MVHVAGGSSSLFSTTPGSLTHMLAISALMRLTSESTSVPTARNCKRRPSIAESGKTPSMLVEGTNARPSSSSIRRQTSRKVQTPAALSAEISALFSFQQ